MIISDSRSSDEFVMVENLSSQLPTLDKYIGRIKRQQTEDKDCLKWDLDVRLCLEQSDDHSDFVERVASSPGARSGSNAGEVSSMFGTDPNGRRLSTNETFS